MEMGLSERVCTSREIIHLFGPCLIECRFLSPLVVEKNRTETRIIPRTRKRDTSTQRTRYHSSSESSVESGTEYTTLTVVSRVSVMNRHRATHDASEIQQKGAGERTIQRMIRARLSVTRLGSCNVKYQ